jgi:hypothetical protein
MLNLLYFLISGHYKNKWYVKNPDRRGTELDIAGLLDTSAHTGQKSMTCMGRKRTLSERVMPSTNQGGVKGVILATQVWLIFAWCVAFGRKDQVESK